MTDATRSKKPKPHENRDQPETHHQTQKVEKTISPAHHTTESYGKAELKDKLPRE